MPVTGRLFADDEELGKKDDDHRPEESSMLSNSSISWPKLYTPRRRKRITIGLLALGLVYVFVKNMPGPGVPIAYRTDSRVPGRTISGWDPRHIHNDAPAQPQQAYGYDEAPTGPPPVPLEKEEDELELSKLGQHYYNGKVRWHFLASTLQSAARAMGYQMRDRNVVFVAAEQQSASRLIPLACEMARWNRNLVHMVLIGRDDLAIDEYKEINGVDDDVCEVYWHDARPDYALYSTDGRFESSVFNGLRHVHNFLRPKAYIMDHPDSEAAPFVKGLRGHSMAMGKPVIPLPPDAIHDLMWITRLDSGSLSQWHNTYIEILIHVPPNSAGSVIRLLKSIERARYFGTRCPHITVELPSQLDEGTENFLNNFIWPPLPSDGGIHTSMLTLRRRIATERLTGIEASIKMVESFYPSRTDHTHVLVLSAQVELSPLYYHYVLYNVLEYKYSSYGEGSWESERLIGISLNHPSLLLDNKTPLKDPSAWIDEESQTRYGKHINFLWQAPDTHATIYFGNTWKEFHSFLAHRFKKAVAAREKIISANVPAFAEHLLELMRVRNYFVLYPHLKGNSIATVHNELYQPPEEFIGTTPVEETGEDNSIQDTDQPFLEPLPPQKPPPSKEQALVTTPLHQLLPADGDLPELSTLPLLSYLGQKEAPKVLSKMSRRIADYFRREVGACPVGYEPTVYKNTAEDLYCDADTDYVALVAEQESTAPEGSVPVGFGGARGRHALLDGELDFDENGDEIEEPVSEEERKQMSLEFEKHLQRQQSHEKSRLADGNVKSPAGPAGPPKLTGKDPGKKSQNEPPSTKPNDGRRDAVKSNSGKVGKPKEAQTHKKPDGESGAAKIEEIQREPRSSVDESLLPAAKQGAVDGEKEVPATGNGENEAQDKASGEDPT